jgi:glycosyltransferase involved in cell wall biosynthesis
MSLIIDETHLGRRASGMERVTQALFSKDALAPLAVTAERCGQGKLGVAFKQTFTLPAKAACRRRSVWVFPGFPPCPAFGLLPDRTVLYVHDVFLITRRQDLNFAGRYWLAPNFRMSLRRLKYFMANSMTTANALGHYIGKGAQVVVYRPAPENVFGLGPSVGGRKASQPERLIVGAIGTVEPRKNFPAAARICEHLAAVAGRPVELHIIGRRGWGDDYDRLSAQPNVTLHGFQPDGEARRIIETFDLLLCTSRDEGLCLPLLEAQFGGLQVVAPDQPVFREVLGRSGIFIDPQDAETSAEVIAASIAGSDWRPRAALAAAGNLDRWSRIAAADRAEAIAFLSGLVQEHC